MFGLLPRADIDVVQDLEMVGEELDGRDEDGSVPLAGELGHDVGEIGRHPLAGLVAGALPAEAPLIVAKVGRLGDESSRFAKLVEVVRLLIGNPAGQGMGGEKYGHKPVAPKRRQSLADASRQGASMNAPSSCQAPATLTFGAAAPIALRAASTARS